MPNVIEKVGVSCDSMGDIELAGVKLEDASKELLDITKGSLDEHVAMQPSAVAYYNALRKAAKRRLDNCQSAYDRWQKKQYALARAAVESGCRSVSAIKVEDVRARFIVDNEPAIENWEARIEKAQEEYDTMDVWCEAWKQKSFTIHDFVNIDEEERYNRTGIAGSANQQDVSHDRSSRDSVRRVRELLGKPRQ